MICISQSNSSRKRTDRQEIQPFPTGRPNEIAVSRRRSPCAVWGAPYQQSRANSTQKPFFSTEARDRQIVAPSTIRRIAMRSEEHTSELQSLMRISYAVFCLKKKINHNTITYKQEYTSNNELKKYTRQL